EGPLRGGSALVYKGILQTDGSKVAVKVFHSRPSVDACRRQRILHEAHLWSKLRHPNIVRMLGISTDFDSTISIISEWMVLGDAHAYVQNKANDPRPLLMDIANGLRYLHTYPSGPIFHGDLKGFNILVSGGHRGHLADFGLSNLSTSSFSMTVELSCGGSLRWMAPELLHNYSKASAESDLWSFGMTILELFTRLLPFHDSQNSPSVMLRVMQGPLPERPNQQVTCLRMTDAWWEICMSCWNRDPKIRPSILTVVEKIEVSG
ncbi:hypothetical protein ID866_13384, partial [Astraeus odoratus]